MNILSFEKQIAIISALTEGCSIRAVERMTGVHRDSIMRLGTRVGMGCAQVHDALMRNVFVNRCELDEAWQFIGKKRVNIKETDPAHFGDWYTFLALDATSRGIISYRVGRRDGNNAISFLRDLRDRLSNTPELSTDAWVGYPGAIEQIFGNNIAYGTLIKKYAAGGATPEAARRYSPATVVSVDRNVVFGAPTQISTSYVERQNLTLRMSQKRYSRLSNGYSKKVENHMAATSLYVAHYNLCKVHDALRVSPAMHLRVTDHVWTISELVEAALNGVVPSQPEGRKVGAFGVINGGKS
jgi:IS1 family transposase